MIKAQKTEEVKFTFHGSDLAQERERLGLTQEQLAVLTGLTQPKIAQYERPYPVTIKAQTVEAFEAAGITFESSDQEPSGSAPVGPL